MILLICSVSLRSISAMIADMVADRLVLSTTSVRFTISPMSVFTWRSTSRLATSERAPTACPASSMIPSSVNSLVAAWLLPACFSISAISIPPLLVSTRAAFTGLGLELFCEVRILHQYLQGLFEFRLGTNLGEQSVQFLAGFE